ncbi:hypothetical protein CCACVL1_02082 [Corchorus capsularis]|uniref:Uncharacterized protein n=1 Tax=Corchorus capsularis TaxID=210143 RepID=A0A1R3KD49_COCAP|nr:hypothetical protein CCACVL1_02082 [Corchorus capsularis]
MRVTETSTSTTEKQCKFVSLKDLIEGTNLDSAEKEGEVDLTMDSGLNHVVVDLTMDSSPVMKEQGVKPVVVDLTMDSSPVLKEHDLNSVEQARKLLRRPRTFWTKKEEDVLVQGVHRHGKAWTHILNSNPTVFRNRTSVDLKDKWRNLHRD